MTSTGLLFVLIGVFVVINAGNFVGVIQGNKSIAGMTGSSTTTTTTTGTTIGSGGSGPKTT